MKKLQYLLIAALFTLAASCKKEYPIPVFTPEKDTWMVNTDTFGPAPLVYYDTANVAYAGVKGKGSLTVRFRKKPTTDGEYVFRAKADEDFEISILIIDSVKNIYWESTDDDGRPLKVQQYANVTVNGSRIGVAFNEKWLKRMDNVDRAKVSINME